MERFNIGSSTTSQYGVHSSEWKWIARHKDGEDIVLSIWQHIAVMNGYDLANHIEMSMEVDLYRITAMVTAATANGHVATAAVTASNAYTKFLAAQEALGNDRVPVKGRIAFVSYAFYNFIKQDTTFMLASDVAMNERINGMVGMVDGVKIVPCPSDLLPANVAFVICHPSVTVGVTKLEDYKIHVDPPGISGIQIDFRSRYDAFVLDAKKNGLWVHKIA